MRTKTLRDQQKENYIGDWCEEKKQDKTKKKKIEQV